MKLKECIHASTELNRKKKSSNKYYVDISPEQNISRDMNKKI